MTARLLIGDVFARLAEIPDGTVDLVVTSPPFLALRSYLPADHPDKALEIGSEATPADFLDTLLALSAEWGRVLAPHGSICVELGDTYAGSGGAGGDYAEGGIRDGQHKFRARTGNGGSGWPLPKSLTGIPTLYAWSLAYGRNLLTGAESPAGQWRIRNLIVWARPNPPVGALGDKFRPATSYVTVACRAKDRWFDLDAVRNAPSRDYSGIIPGGAYTGNPSRNDNGASCFGSHPAGAPPLDWIDERDADWQPFIGLPTQPYKGAHYAAFPSALPSRLIDAMCPREVCTLCGEPRRRVVDLSYVDANGNPAPGEKWRSGVTDGQGAHSNKKATLTTTTTTLGWSECDCPHPAYRPGLVLDPFAGSGTTLAAAIGVGRHAIGIDVDERNADLARERCGIFLEVVE